MGGGGLDVAVSPILRLRRSVHAAAAVGIPTLLTAAEEEKDDIGEADDVFMVGRFIDYDGEKTNIPAFRFGHISIKEAILKQETDFKGRSIVVDMHSRTGYSGSPVFVYRTPGSSFPEKDHFITGNMLRLLGIHWGQFREPWDVKDKPPKNGKRANFYKRDPQYVEALSGMTCVVPAQAIIDLLLNDKNLIAMREEEEKRIAPDVEEELMKRPQAETASKEPDAPTKTDTPPSY